MTTSIKRNRFFNKFLTVSAVTSLLMLQACGGGSSTPPPEPELTDVWTWMSGSDLEDQDGVYGTKGIPDAANTPGARAGSVSWKDANGNLLLFGGTDFGFGYFNDLWRWDGSNWTWLSGSDTGDQVGIYGVKGVANSNNVPGSRYEAISWTDASGNLWLFGGRGIDSAAMFGTLNDLWRWDGANWTWISGSDTIDQIGTYGTKGVADTANVPGARLNAISWTDANNNLWLFGGFGFDSAGTESLLNDLWRWDGTNWTWISGGNVVDQTGVYGTKGVADAANIPGARENSVSWIDSNGNLWLFGGTGYDSTGTVARFNDLWRWDGANWIWISGSNTINQIGTYGTKGTADAANVPGARRSAISWVDSNDNLWLFSGFGNDSATGSNNLNDLWQWDGTNWIWMSGSDVIKEIGVFGTKGVASKTNKPGARVRSISWIDTNGDLWLFGGSVEFNTGDGNANDLWKYKP